MIAENLNVFNEVIAQLPGMMTVVDRESKCIAINNDTAQLYGFKDAAAAIGKCAHDMNCSAIDCAVEFIKQDQTILETEKELVLFGVYTYAADVRKILISKKKPFYVNNKLYGVVHYNMEIESKTLQRLTASLIESDRNHHRKTTNDRSYTINNYTHSKLTSREEDCLSYIVRGKTSVQIANFLCISRRTVETHIDNIKDKFSCTKKSDLIEIGILNGYLNLIPPALLQENYTKLI